MVYKQKAQFSGILCIIARDLELRSSLSGELDYLLLRNKLKA